MIREARLPNSEVAIQVLLNAIGESSLDKLHGLLQGNIRRWSNNQVKVIGHNNEFVQQVLPFFTNEGKFTFGCKILAQF